MKFFKCAVCVIFAISIANLTTSIYIYNDILERQDQVEVKIEIPEGLKNLPEHSQMRERQLMQGMFMIHHQLGIHPPGKHPMCPMCRQGPKVQAVMVTKE